ncbi:MAG: cell division protein FtsQ/DivIB [Balneolaceae bacterium]
MPRKNSAISWIRSRALPLTGGLLLLGTAILFGLHLERTTVVDEYRFVGLERVDESELRELTNLPTGIHPDSINFRSIMDPLLGHPWIRETTVRPQTGGRMALHITEREPIAILIAANGRCYMDRDGMRMDLRGQAVDLPLVHGFSCRIGDQLEGDAFDDVRNFLTTMQRDPLSWHTLSEVSWNHREGVTALTQENGVKILFGKGEFERKQTYWNRFYREVVTKEGIESFRTVDLRFQKQIVTEKTPAG